MANLIGVSVVRVDGLVKEGTVVKLTPGQYDLTASVQAYCARLRGGAAGRGGEAEVLDLTKERARLAREQADAQEIKNAVSREEFVSVTETERVWGDAIRDLRSRLLSVPSRVRQLIPGMTAAEVLVMDAELRATMEAIGRGTS